MSIPHPRIVQSAMVMEYGEVFSRGLTCSIMLWLPSFSKSLWEEWSGGEREAIDILGDGWVEHIKAILLLGRNFFSLCRFLASRSLKSAWTAGISGGLVHRFIHTHL